MQKQQYFLVRGSHNLLAVFLLQDLLNEARQRIADMVKDPERYSKLLDGLVLQVNYAAQVERA